MTLYFISTYRMAVAGLSLDQWIMITKWWPYQSQNRWQ